MTYTIAVCTVKNCWWWTRNCPKHVEFYSKNTFEKLVHLVANFQQTCMTYTIAVCTVKNCWWWTEELSETCRVLFQKYIWVISASIWFYYKNLSRCTVTWTSIETSISLLPPFCILYNTWTELTIKVLVTTMWVRYSPYIALWRKRNQIIEKLPETLRHSLSTSTTWRLMSERVTTMQ